MNVTTLRGAKHQCALPNPREGAIIRCDDCGKLWLGHQPPNFRYWRWTRLTRLGAWLRGAR